MAQQHGKSRPGAGAPTLDRSLGDIEQGGGVGYRVAVHVDGYYCGALFDRKAHQCLPDHDRRLDTCGSVGQDVAVVGQRCRCKNVAAHPIQAGIDHDPVQPTTDCGIMTKSPRCAVCREHRLLHNVGGIFCGLAASLG